MQLIPPVQQMDRQNHHRLWVYCAVCTLYMSYCTSYCVLCNTYSIVFHVLYFVQYILYCEVAIKTPTDRPVFPTTTSQQPIHLCFHRHCHCHQNHVQCFFFICICSLVLFICVNICICISHNNFPAAISTMLPSSLSLESCICSVFFAFVFFPCFLFVFPQCCFYLREHLYLDFPQRPILLSLFSVVC